MARGFEQRHRLRVFADLDTHVVTELHADLDVSGLVPALAGHVEVHRERHAIGVVVKRGAPGALKRLDLAHEDAVHLTPRPVADIDRLAVERALLALAWAF